MAVTATAAAPTSKALFVGPYGPIANGVFVSNDGALFENKRVKISRLNLSGTYATNGFALTPATFGLKEIHGLAVICDNTSGGAAVPSLTTTGSSPIVKLVTNNTPTELANGTSVANWSYTVLVIGV